jgi:hypothetical protein
MAPPAACLSSAGRVPTRDRADQETSVVWDARHRGEPECRHRSEAAR